MAFRLPVNADNPGIAIASGPPPASSSGAGWATWIPFLFLIAVWFTMIRRMQRPKTET